MFNHVGAGRFQFLGGILANLSSCVVLDRFQAVEAVDTLETKAHELMQQNSFLASKYLAENVLTKAPAPIGGYFVSSPKSILTWFRKIFFLDKV